MHLRLPITLIPLVFLPHLAAQLSQSYKGLELLIVSVEPKGLNADGTARAPSDPVWTPGDPAYTTSAVHGLDRVVFTIDSGSPKFVNRREGEIFVIVKVKVTSKSNASPVPFGAITLTDRPGNPYACLISGVSLGGGGIETREFGFSVPVDAYRGLLALMNGGPSPLRLQRLTMLKLDALALSLEDFMEAISDKTSVPTSPQRSRTAGKVLTGRGLAAKVPGLPLLEWGITPEQAIQILDRAGIAHSQIPAKFKEDRKSGKIYWDVVHRFPLSGFPPQELLKIMDCTFTVRFVHDATSRSLRGIYLLSGGPGSMTWNGRINSAAIIQANITSKVNQALLERLAAEYGQPIPGQQGFSYWLVGEHTRIDERVTYNDRIPYGFEISVLVRRQE
jgi:hypothetical protein